MTIYAGIDWAEHHHDIARVDAEGTLVAKRRIGESAEGFTELLALLADAGDTLDEPIPVAIETPRGLLVAALRETGRAIYAINPMAVARYRERHSVSRKKSDHVDAMTLANILRTDAHAHRTLPADTELARAIAVLARAAQDAIWRRTKATQELRSVLREYYPGLLAAFTRGGATRLASSEAREVLTIAPTPAAGAKLSKSRIAAALRRAGRQRGIDAFAVEIQQALRTPQLRQLPLIEEAMGRQTTALLATLITECDNADQLGQAAIEAFQQHPDHEIITSFPGLGDLTGARLLAEIGDDRARFADARALKAYAGSAPVTRASGAQPLDHPTPGQKRPAQRHRLPLGLRQHPPTRTSQRTLRPPTIPRRPPRRRPTTPLQPHARPALPLPAHRPDLRPDQSLRTPNSTHQASRSLTLSEIGGLDAWHRGQDRRPHPRRDRRRQRIPQRRTPGRLRRPRPIHPPIRQQHPRRKPLPPRKHTAQTSPVPPRLRRTARPPITGHLPAETLRSKTPRRRTNLPGPPPRRRPVRHAPQPHPLPTHTDHHLTSPIGAPFRANAGTVDDGSGPIELTTHTELVEHGSAQTPPHPSLGPLLQPPMRGRHADPERRGNLPPGTAAGQHEHNHREHRTVTGPTTPATLSTDSVLRQQRCCDGPQLVGHQST